MAPPAAAAEAATPARRPWQFWRALFTAACYACIASISITASIVAPIFALAGPGARAKMRTQR